MARPSNTAQRRLEIVQALLRIMSTYGYESASIQAIAKEAGLRSGLIHYHFKTKQEILVELIKWLGDKGRQRYISLAETANTPKAQIEAFIDSALALGKGADHDAVAAWVVIGAEAIRQTEIQQLYGQIVAQNKKELKRLFEEYAKKNNVKLTSASLDHLAGITIASIAGAYQLAVTAGDIMPKNYAAKMLNSTIFSFLEK